MDADNKNRNPEPGTRNPEPGTWNLEPGTWNLLCLPHPYLDLHRHAPLDAVFDGRKDGEIGAEPLTLDG